MFSLTWCAVSSGSSLSPRQFSCWEFFWDLSSQDRSQTGNANTVCCFFVGTLCSFPFLVQMDKDDLLLSVMQVNNFIFQLHSHFHDGIMKGSTGIKTSKQCIIRRIVGLIVSYIVYIRYIVLKA